MWIRETWTSQVYVKKQNKKKRKKNGEVDECEVIMCLASDEKSKRTNRKNKKKRTTDTKTIRLITGSSVRVVDEYTRGERIEMVRAKQTSLADSRDSRDRA